MAAERVMLGNAEVVIAGGAESMSMVPMGGNKTSPNPWLMDHYPDAYLGMGLTAENLVRKYGITREKADEFSYCSHQKALAAIAAGKFKDEIVPVEVRSTVVSNGDGRGGRAKTATKVFDTDEGPRADTSLDALAKLKPAFHAHGTVTAGNSSQMSDGAATSVVMSADRARALGVKPLARFLAFATAGCPPEEMGVGPVFAIPKALRLAGLKLEQIDVIELNEAFAAQSLSVIGAPGLIPRASTSMAAPSLSAIPWVARGRSSPLRSCANSSAARPAMAWLPCASAAAWAPQGFSSAFRIATKVGPFGGDMATTATPGTLAPGGSFLLESPRAEDVFTPAELTDDQRLIGQTAEEFVTKEVMPLIPELEQHKEGLMAGLLKKAGEIGLLGGGVPEEYGGSGLDRISSTVLSEKISSYGSFSVSAGAHSGIGTLPIVYFGTEEQKKKYLPKLATGEWLAAYCLSEPQAGSDAQNSRTRAVLSPDGRDWILNGQKMWITNGGFADVYTVFAKVDGEKFSAFIVERGSPDFP